MKHEGMDDGVTVAEVRQAVADLKAIRGRKGDLDRLVDALPTRRRSHVVEEGLRAVLGGVPLWRARAESGGASECETAALAWLNSEGLRMASGRRTHRKAPETLEAVQVVGTPHGADVGGDGEP